MITITDIAAKAGVSRSTVSYVLNERNTAVQISAKTRQRVIDASRELGYRRNELARAVITGKNTVLGFWVMNSEQEPDVRILSGAMKEAEANDYFIKMLSLDSNRDASEIAEHCIDWRLSGIIAINAPSEVLDLVQSLVSRFDIPVVMVEGEGPRPDCHYVTSQQESGITEAVKHLASLGHKKIAFLTGSSLPDTRDQAYCKAMQDLGLASFIDVSYSDWNLSTLQKSALNLIEREPSRRPTAICCVCDHVAMILMSTAGQLGLRIPQDIAVTGFDDLAIASIYNPPLTTIAQPFEEMGRVAVRRLLSLLGNSKEFATGTTESLPTKLIVRSSTTTMSSEAARDSIFESDVHLLNAEPLSNSAYLPKK